MLACRIFCVDRLDHLFPEALDLLERRPIDGPVGMLKRIAK